MTKRNTWVAIAVALAVSMSGSAFADIYDFEDVIDRWGILGVDSILVTEGNPLEYSHDLSQEVDFAAGDEILTAALELDFTNDWSDDTEVGKWTGIVWYDYREFVKVAYDGNGFVDIDEQDNGQYDLVLDITWLTDGMLDVRIDVYNYGVLNNADVFLDHSRLYGTAQAVVPVPGAVLLGVLGLGTAGMRLRKRS